MKRRTFLKRSATASAVVVAAPATVAKAATTPSAAPAPTPIAVGWDGSAGFHALTVHKHTSTIQLSPELVADAFGVPRHLLMVGGRPERSFSGCHPPQPTTMATPESDTPS